MAIWQYVSWFFTCRFVFSCFLHGCYPWSNFSKDLDQRSAEMLQTTSQLSAPGLGLGGLRGADF